MTLMTFVKAVEDIKGIKGIRKESSFNAWRYRTASKPCCGNNRTRECPACELTGHA